MPNTTVKLLLVDDNPMVLGMLRGALTPLANVTTSNDSADALLKAVDDPPDLLVSDYRMPGMDGHQLVEKLKSRPKTAGISVILLASKADITEKLSNHEPVDDFVEKPFFLKEATKRIKRVIDKIALEKMAKTAPSDGVLRGSLSQMNVIDLVQSLEMGRKRCTLTLTNGKDKCERAGRRASGPSGPRRCRSTKKKNIFHHRDRSRCRRSIRNSEIPPTPRHECATCCHHRRHWHRQT